ncbi:hypothetical protein NDU88_006041 [Pleurodeles waltl]|uniref:Uncharacterized protein n=1 Tax=Pleurodeles waltl TaxID=8319 RepID=A0AAV7W9H1_PLEWA|nr:hypothetical protein NDU88_006041 [Pleurodeles waltl]
MTAKRSACKGRKGQGSAPSPKMHGRGGPPSPFTQTRERLRTAALQPRREAREWRLSPHKGSRTGSLDHGWAAGKARIVVAGGRQARNPAWMAALLPGGRRGSGSSCLVDGAPAPGVRTTAGLQIQESEVRLGGRQVAGV